ncbi:MAG: glucose-1-phosphate thymidylyltransferase [Candidatus Bathyarchaeota archaeon]|nr:glucose-1-phosphate thymidylyltransferase [Candidatus Bathyarchaeum tardum]WGM90267.1 MAG: glucose-1-phosphate thymidylyltransferase [Candidatus Bathyarchaeum tardum]WNZ29645.1 MAG: glucose-1-phosphate thymidylyltransferase [Candidatus Bathyarchaeota archaeon]
MKALVLSGGKGTRLRPLTFTLAKQLIPMANKPVLGYVLDQITQTGINQIGVIIAPETGHYVKDYIKDGKKWNSNVTYILQEPLGLAHAVKTAKPFLGQDDFIMGLGDNLQGQGLTKFVEKFETENMDALIILKQVEDPSKFGVATLDKNSNIIKLVEKPKTPESNLAIIGTYIFSNKIFKAIEQIKPSWRGELEITDAIQEMINMGFKVKAEILNSWWIDTGKKDDILTANAKVLDEYMQQQINGTVENSKIEGRVAIQKTAKIINSTIRGPCAIGSDCIIENSFVGPYTSIGNGTKIVDSAIEYSVVLENAQITGVDRLEESLIGKNAKITRNHKNGCLKLHVGDYSEVEL